MSPLLHVLISLTAVIALGHVLARVLTRVGQPAVIGEILAGILLGPSLLGAFSSQILPATSAPYLGVIAQIAVVLYMFVVGLDLHPDRASAGLRATVVISKASIVAPFVLGGALAYAIAPRVSSPDVPLVSFVLFMSVAMSVTAFPVLARILTDRGLAQTPIGVVALSCAAVGDVLAWCLLAAVVSITRAEAGSGLLVAGGALVYLAVMFGLVRPLIARFAMRELTPERQRSALTIMFIALLLSAIATELIGIHAIFGAFLLGAIVPSQAPIARALVTQLREPVSILLLPAFFAFTGMLTRIDLVRGAEAWLICGAIILVATAGKFGGAFAAARWVGYAPREAAVLGALMNTRGLMELIVLNVGLELGVISPTVFSMMVIMALVTTMIASPILDGLMRKPPARSV